MNMFIPGETIAHEFIIPFVRSDIGRIYVTFYQNGRTVIEKSVPSQQIVQRGTEESYFVIILTQYESLLFDDRSEYFMQLNMVFKNGTRSSSHLMRGETGIQHIRKVVTANG